MRRRSTRNAAWLALLILGGGVRVAGRGTSVVEAVKAGDRSVVRALLAEGADVNAAEPDGTTSLHWAVRADDLDIAEWLLAAGADARAANRNGVTPLWLAAVNGDAAMIERLLDAGVDPNATWSDGQTPLMTAARTGDAEAVALLLRRGADVNAKEHVLGETALIWAAGENHADVVRLLVGAGADVNGTSSVLEFPRRTFGDGKSGRHTVLPAGGWTPLMYAARGNALAALRALAGAGADLNRTDPDGTTALVLAIINAHYDAAALLLEQGADPNVPDVTGMAALYAAVDMHTLSETPGRPSPQPSGELDNLAFLGLLLQAGSDPNQQLKERILTRVHQPGDPNLAAGATPLMRAAKKGDLAAMRLLLEHGADPRVRTDAQATALMYAAGLGGLGRFDEYDHTRGTEADMIEAMRLCLDHGADVNAIDENGQTALHIAVRERDKRAVAFLAQRGAKLDVQDRSGRTPLDVALGVGNRGRGRRGAPPVVRDDVAALLRQLMEQ